MRSAVLNALWCFIDISAFADRFCWPLMQKAEVYIAN